MPFTIRLQRLHSRADDLGTSVCVPFPWAGLPGRTQFGPVAPRPVEADDGRLYLDHAKRVARSQVTLPGHVRDQLRCRGHPLGGLDHREPFPILVTYHQDRRTQVTLPSTTVAPMAGAIGSVVASDVPPMVASRTSPPDNRTRAPSP